MKRSLYFTIIQERENKNEIIIDDGFAYAVATQISKENDDDDRDTEPRTINECWPINDCPKWESVTQAELESLNKRGVFRPTVQTPKDVNPVGYKWMFVRKMNEIFIYKARLVAQGFLQNPGIDYEET